ncbi:hypothetical protein UFOVP1383_29 [uncultured Caudovirales phage]|uniref:Uncharacterized protein n=1 Tax=uncultured Caudovirales phage TaxID=2100421 RepID=A0A6J5PWI0_9CAUD|nr:hypothetical protein UFOVP848_12 [uncultured Caudovirales phage]CAB4173408.1 hypothetical protein UFOVP945_53 [uncultured Caudovirales phage]CAB4179681.1 hypothetical protein UFOVP1023_48 [uncultured Caudovirales phage]CAB4204089.1 hypothetical protein UFOVP1383_29 [uncultured Caudovirales phage]CAB4215883.1 hypothetical protein UFOVP1477_19 [uncultured Caudovirales phage]
MAKQLTKKVVSAQSTGTAAATATVATVLQIAGVPLARVKELRARLNVTVAMGGDTPTLNVYLQRPVAEDPDPAIDADWEDFYAFPQATNATLDKVVTLPLPHAQDVDASLATASRTRAIQALTADTVIGGHWSGPIRIRHVVTKGAGAITAGTYDVEFVGR